MTIEWNTTVSYEKAIDLLSTDQRLTKTGWTVGTNSKAHLDSLTVAQCEARAHGAWNANCRQEFVAYKSAALHKGG